MSHYYSKNNDQLKSNEQDIHVKIFEKTFHFITDNGVFSKSGLDFGSRLLIETILDVKKSTMLDLGTGYGPIGIVYKAFFNDSNVVMTDINIRASELAKKNAMINHVDVDVLNGDGFEPIKQTFDIIVTNPPIRTGKTSIYQMFENAQNYLNPEGVFVFVMHKKHGVASALKKCEDIFSAVKVVNKKSGYHIIWCIK